MTRRRAAVWLSLWALATAPGCGPNELESVTANRLRGLARVYLDYAVSHTRQGPGSEEAFKKHVRGLPSDVLRTNGLDPGNLDAAFVSERDGEPFAVRYGIVFEKIGGTSAPLVAHEKTGRNGKRLVAFANAKAELVDETRLQELLSAKP